MPANEAVVPVTDDGFLRGDGVFEVVRVYDGRPYALVPHLDRLEHSAANLRLPYAVPRALIESEAAELIQARGGTGFDGVLRIVLTTGGSRLLMTEPLPDSPERARLCFVTYAPTRLLDGVKSLSYAANMLAGRIARERGFDEALFVTPHGRVLEAPTSSLFWVSTAGELLTPPLEDHVLASITRERLLALTGARECAVSSDELLTAREAFLASTTREVQPVAAIEQLQFESAGSARARPPRRCARTSAQRSGERPGRRAGGIWSRGAPFMLWLSHHAVCRPRSRPTSRPSRARIAAPRSLSVMRIVTVIGNRPQFVKAAAVSRPLRERHEELIVHTGQHYDDELSRIFFDELSVPPPEYELDVHDGSPTSQTARMLGALEPLLAELAPDLVLVYGDTNSTLAGALAAAQMQLPVAHVEAGMRSFDRRMPEELNRVLTDHASDLLLCSTATAVANLEREHVAGEVALVGDAMADVTLAFAPLASERSRAIEENGLEPGRYAVVTAHRAGNVDDPARLERLVALLEALPVAAIFPVHPRTRARLEAAPKLLARLERAPLLKLVRPLGYLDLLALARSARAVLTDSGGLQKEAYLLGTPCITLRDTTEWVETVESGWNVLVDLDAAAALSALERPPPAAERPELYGGGHAGERIRDALDAYTDSP